MKEIIRTVIAIGATLVVTLYTLTVEEGSLELLAVQLFALLVVLKAIEK